MTNQNVTFLVTCSKEVTW